MARAAGAKAAIYLHAAGFDPAAREPGLNVAAYLACCSCMPHLQAPGLSETTLQAQEPLQADPRAEDGRRGEGREAERGEERVAAVGQAVPLRPRAASAPG